MTSNPQPMQVRRGGAKRGEHGTYVAPAATAAGPPPASRPAPRSEPIGTDSARTSGGRSRVKAAAPISDATARAKAAYDAKPKVIFRGVDEEINAKLRAIYKHQLHQAGGVEGWSEWGRGVLQQIVDQYEQVHGEMTGGEDVHLQPGRTPE